MKRILLMLLLAATITGCDKKADNTPNPELGPPPEHKSEGGRGALGKK
jgi:hypothetical protein